MACTNLLLESGECKNGGTIENLFFGGVGRGGFFGGGSNGKVVFGAEVLLVQRTAVEVAVKEVLGLRSNVVNCNTGAWWPL